MKKFVALGLAGALIAGSLGASIASAEARGQERDRGGSEAGAAIAGGIFGFALGALASQQNDYPQYYYPSAPYPPVVYAPQYPAYAQNSHVAWCEQNYRSYNPGTDTYLGYDGYYHYCVAPY